MLFFFLFKQKTAYEMRISDWSSDVCSSDLWIAHNGAPHGHPLTLPARELARIPLQQLIQPQDLGCPINTLLDLGLAVFRKLQRKGHIVVHEIGRASCRERVCQYV